jgi:hypothetical protein
MMVVFSLPTSMRLARPRSCRVGLLQGEADFLGDDGAAGEDGHVFQHGLAAVAEAGGLDGAGLEDAADVVHHQGGQGLALHVLGDDQQGLAGLGHLFQHGQQVTDVGDLLVEQQDEGILQHRHLLLGVVDEVGGQVAPVELHAFHHVQLVLQAGTVFHGDDAFLAHLVHGAGDDVADGSVGVGGDGTHLGDFLAGGAGLGDGLEFLGDGDDGLVDAALEVHGVHAGGDELHALAEDGLGQHGGGGGAVTGDVGGLGGDFLHHLGAHVLELVLELDLLGHGHAVLGHGGGAEGAVQHHVAALGAQGHLDRVGQDIDAGHHAVPGGITKTNVFSCHVQFLLESDPSFRRKPESRGVGGRNWIPACAGMTCLCSR